jgi:hypothetical protein
MKLTVPRWVMAQAIKAQADAMRHRPVVLYGPDNRPIDHSVTVSGAAVGQTVTIRRPQRYPTS